VERATTEISDSSIRHDRFVYLLIAMYLLIFVVESTVAGRWRTRIVYADTWLTGLLELAFFALVFISLKNLESAVGKLGLAVIVATTVLRLGLDLYFGG